MTSTPAPSSTDMPPPPLILDKKLISDGVCDLLEYASNELTEKHGIPSPSKDELLAMTETVFTYLAQHHLRRLRRSRKPLDPANLSLQVLRNRNPAETFIDDEGKKVKGEKIWYYFILAETEEGTGDVDILAEGALRKDKSELLEGFMEAVAAKVDKWMAANKVGDEE